MSVKLARTACTEGGGDYEPSLNSLATALNSNFTPARHARVMFAALAYPIDNKSGAHNRNYFGLLIFSRSRESCKINSINQNRPQILVLGNFIYLNQLLNFTYESALRPVSINYHKSAVEKKKQIN